MDVKIICVGKLKEEYWRAACAEYAKRMTPMCRFSITEIPECRLPNDPSQAEIDAGMEKEADNILEKIGDAGSVYVLAMCVEGDIWSSEQLADGIMKAGISGKSSVAVIIGGSYGLSPRVKKRADKRISIGRMTFPHQLCRVMMCEQLYRAFMINSNQKYHK